MANHCNNYMQISSENEDDIKQIVELFNQIGILNYEKKDLTLYNQLCKNDDDFGTKWIELYDTLYHNDGDTHLELNFTTAWGPSLEFSQKISEVFPNCNIIHEFSESGNDFGGCYHYSNGNCIERIDLTYLEYLKNYDPEQYTEEMQYLIYDIGSDLMTSLTKKLNLYDTQEFDSNLIAIVNNESVSHDVIKLFFNVFYENYTTFINDEYYYNFQKSVIIPIITSLKSQKKLKTKDIKNYFNLLSSPDTENHTIVYELINLKFNS